MAAIDLASLTPDEVDRLESILRTLPADKLLDAVAWETIAEAVRAPGTATVAGMLDEIERARQARQVRDELRDKLDQIGRRLRNSPHFRPPKPMSTRQARDFVDGLVEAVKGTHAQRRALWATFNRRNSR